MKAAILTESEKPLVVADIDLPDKSFLIDNPVFDNKFNVSCSFFQTFVRLGGIV